MVVNQAPTSPESQTRQRARQLQIAAVMVLLLGAVGVGVVYWVAAGSADLPDETTATGYYKSETRQVEQIYGQEGLLVEEWSEDLKQPGPQACIIIVVTALLAGGCFYLARLRGGGKRGDATGPAQEKT